MLLPPYSKSDLRDGMMGMMHVLNIKRCVVSNKNYSLSDKGSTRSNTLQNEFHFNSNIQHIALIG